MDTKDSENDYAVVEELPMENITKDNICYDQVLCADTKHTTTSPVTRESRKDSKTKFIIAIVVIVLVLSAICVCTICMLLEFFRIKSDVASIKMILSPTMNASRSHDVLNQEINDLVGTLNTSIEQIQVRENENQQITNASLDVLHQQINDLASTLNTSIEQIQIREDEKQQKTNASLDVLHQQINDLASTLNTSIEQIQIREDEKLQKTNASLDVLSKKINSFHPASCAAILQLYPSSPSGYYWIRSSNSSAVHVYCNMTLSCGNITGGWMRVAELDMTDNDIQCPNTLTQRIDSNKRTCGSNYACGATVIYSIDDIEYSKVCGKIKAYQVGSTDAFTNRYSIDSNYVDGISLTHGSQPRKHIWTFAASIDEVGSFTRHSCLCTNINYASGASTPPALVGNDYFCDTASQG